MDKIQRETDTSAPAGVQAMMKREVKTSFVKLPDGTIPKATPFLKKKPAVNEGPKVVKESTDEGDPSSAGSFAGMLHVTAHKIEVHKNDEFSDTAGFLDRTDPYVLLQIGREQQKTSSRNNVRPCEQ